MSSLIKEMNRYAKPLLLRNTDVLKTSIWSERKFEETHYLWRAKAYKVYLGETFILTLSSSAVFRLQNHVSDLF